MNNENFKKGIEDLRNIKLSESEKSSMWNELSKYSENHPPVLPIKTPWHDLVFSSFVLRTGTLMASVFVLFIGGLGTFMSAENSLPGDKLYSLKVDVIEPFKYTLTTNPISKANMVVENLDNRLREAESLDIQGKLSDPVHADLEQRIRDKVDSFNGLVASVDSGQNSIRVSDAKINFEAKVSAHSRILDEIENISNNRSSGKAKKLKSVISPESSISMATMMASENDNARVATFAVTEVDSPKQKKAETEKLSMNDSEFKKMKKETEKMIKETKDKIEKGKNNKKINKTLLNDAINSISQAEVLLNEANKQYGESNIEYAVQNLLDSRRMLKEAMISFGVAKDLPREVEDD